MSTTLGIALCALIGVVALVFERGLLEIRLTDLESETKLLYELSQSQQKYIDSLANYVRHLSESCSQIEDLDTAIKVSQKDIEHALDMIEELKAKRSMDILDKLRKD